MKPTLTKRPPVVVVMGHIDHGKSTLLDYIRKSNVVEKEAGGITQHIAAYEVVHNDEKGEPQKITFLDTPGHEAFSKMRARGAETADIAILVVSAEDSVKAQTVEAWETIQKSKLPTIVAINKIDKPNANIEKTKIDLAEKGIYLEGYGGETPWSPISAKAGTGINELLDLILLVAELHEFTGDTNTPATGFVIESRLDPKRGIAATLIIKNGTLKKGEFVVAEGACVGTRILENFLGKTVAEATFSSPIQLVGFDTEPGVGSTFSTHATKKSAEKEALEWRAMAQKKSNTPIEAHTDETIRLIPLVIKTDVAGSGEAILSEIKKLELPTLKWKVINQGVGAVSEGDMKLALADQNTIIIAFNVGVDARAYDISLKSNIPIHAFDIIYKLSDFLTEQAINKKPKVQSTELVGSAKILKVFNDNKGKQVAGGKVVSGIVKQGAQVSIMRQGECIGEGTMIEIQHNKEKVRSVEEGKEFGFAIDSATSINPGDVIESVITVEK